MSKDIAAAADVTLADAVEADVRVVVRALLNTALAVMDEKPGLYLELIRHWPTVGTLTVVEVLERHLVDACRRYLLHHHAKLAVSNLPAALFVVINATLFTVMRYLSLSAPDFDRDQLVETLSEMIAGYADSAWARTPL